MRQIVIAILMLLMATGTEAKVVKVTMADGTRRIYSTSQLSSIDFNNDGSIVMTTYDGKTTDLTGGQFEEVSIDDEAAIMQITDTTVVFPEKDAVYDRHLKKIDFAYPSADPHGNPTTLSGSILIPEEIYDGTTACDGILLFNRFTATGRYQAPTHGYFIFETFYLSCPLKLNYIVVVSDFYGFGISDRYPQAFIQGTANARASIDALFAARELLSGMGIDYGSLLFNLGYSSGGFDALAVQKLRDMEYHDVLAFDKTFAGAGPLDITEAYRDYVSTNQTAFMTGIALMMVSTNETQQLGLDYSDIFNPPLDKQVPQWIFDKNVETFALNIDILDKAPAISDLMTPAYSNLSSEQSQALCDVLEDLSITTGWIPDPSQKIYVMQSRDDDYVPFASGKPIVQFLKNHGFTPSPYPGTTNLQSNFAFKNLTHIMASAVFFFETLFALKAWPTIYDVDGNLKEKYRNVLSHENMFPTETMRMMNEVGIDTKWLKNLPSNVDLDFNIEGLGDIDAGNLLTDSPLEIYNSMLPKGTAEKQAMKEDCGADISTYLRRLRNLLIAIGITN